MGFGDTELQQIISDTCDSFIGDQQALRCPILTREVLHDWQRIAFIRGAHFGYLLHDQAERDRARANIHV